MSHHDSVPSKIDNLGLEDIYQGKLAGAEIADSFLFLPLQNAMSRKRSVSPGEGPSSRKPRPLPNAVEDTFEDYIFQNLFEDDPFENMSESCKSMIRPSMHSSSYLTHDNIYP